MEINPIICSWIRFQDLLDSDTHFCCIYSFGVPNETLFNLVIDIFKSSTSREISLWVCTSGQKGFIQVIQVHIFLDAGARPILMLLYQFWAHQFQDSKLRIKSLKLSSFKSILQCETFIEQWNLGLLLRTYCLVDSQQPQPPESKVKIGFLFLE